MSTESTGQRPPAPDYGIIFNNDGGYLKHAEFPMSVEDLLERIYEPPNGDSGRCLGVVCRELRRHTGPRTGYR